MQNINNLFENLDQSLLSVPQQADQINSILNQLDQELIVTQNENYQLFGYYQYLIADQCLDQFTFLTQNQRLRYKNQLKLFEKTYEEYIKGLETNLESLTNEQIQIVEYNHLILQRRKNQGTSFLSSFSNTIKNILNSAKSKQALQNTIQLSNQGLKDVSNCKQAALSVEKATLPKTNTIISIGIAAAETSKIYCDYLNLIEKSNKEPQQKEEALKDLLNQLKALGARTISSFSVTTAFAVGGATLGSLFPIVGTYVGGILGALLGGICSYFIEKHVINPLFLEKNDSIIEYEREIGLHNYKIINNGQDYTKEEFDFKYKKCLLNEHPDKQQSDTLKAVAREKIFRIYLAKEMIYKHKGWAAQ